MHRRGLRTFLARLDCEYDVRAVFKLLERQPLERVHMKVDFAAALPEDESIAFVGEQLADYSDRKSTRLNSSH